ncbi:nucleoside triphosphate pyrophosphatase [Thalassovita sp.]|uniref:Maf family protein n=1 Tax=Thalassovita sp. TaxID=1979401 RepID=UPI0029DE5AA3|nr:nucleoside triphosphate pyrophosphatase [Thalassovita sp.]
MTKKLILASGSEIRQQLLRNAGVSFEIQKARVDESLVRDSMVSGDSSPRDIADALAELKALKVSQKHRRNLVLGCDQVLDLNGCILSKPQDKQEARRQLLQMRGQEHRLISAAVICEDARPIWRHVGQVRMRMRVFSEDYLDGYLERNWPAVSGCVGAYQLESEGIRLFSQIDGDYFSVLGLPLLELLNYLTVRGDLQA